MYRTVAAALVMALALALAGCGGSEITTVSRAELVHRLETACLTAQRLTLTAPPRDPRRYLEVIITNQKYVLGRIGNLETTGPAKAVFDGFKTTIRQRLVAYERIVAASRADFWRVVAQERPLISASGPKTHAVLVALGARHVCL
ncbi:MAG TPA: hypothetical protein VFU94_00680 [Conexibacter sp.]|nr:hypothetical protein [Conexibacter sp.]